MTTATDTPPTQLGPRRARLDHQTPGEPLPRPPCPSRALGPGAAHRREGRRATRVGRLRGEHRHRRDRRRRGAAQRRRTHRHAARRHGRPPGQGGHRPRVRQHRHRHRPRRAHGPGHARLRTRHARHLAGGRHQAAGAGAGCLARNPHLAVPTRRGAGDGSAGDDRRPPVRPFPQARRDPRAARHAAGRRADQLSPRSHPVRGGQHRGAVVRPRRATARGPRRRSTRSSWPPPPYFGCRRSCLARSPRSNRPS